VSAAATIRLHYLNKLAAGSVRVKRTERERPVNGQFVVPAGGQVKVPTLRVFLSGC
jgi:hypothetical protein